MHAIRFDEGGRAGRRMNVPADREDEKRRAAEAAVAEIGDGMLVGLGSGSTVAMAIEALADRVAAGLRVRIAVASDSSRSLAEAHGLVTLDFGDLAAVDLCIDGVDEIDPAFRAIKGGGGAMLREKIIATAATRMIAIADRSKPVPVLARAVPVEILPFARASVLAHIGRLGGQAALRGGVSDQGNLIADCAFADLSDPAALATSLSAIPGLLGHGLFLDEIDTLIVARGDAVEQSDRPRD